MNETVTSARSSADEYTGPPREWFLGADWLGRDIESVFRPRWLLAGHLDQLAEPGHRQSAYITFRLGAEEVLIRKDGDGDVRAYHNVCAHRGAQLCPGRSGVTMGKRIVCPYHGWSYSASDGALVAAPHMHRDLDLSALRLRAVHVDVWLDLIFVCLDDRRPPAVADYLGGASFGGYDLSDMKLAATKAHEIRANWKIIVENNLECYHCAINHPELCEVFDWRYNATDDFDGALAIRATGYEVLEASYPSSPHTLNGERVCAVPSPRRDNDSDPASYALMWEPGAVLSLSRDNGWIFAPRPISPDRTELRQYWFVAKDAQEGRDYDVQSLMRFWDITMMQDREICEGVQRGMEMPAYTPGPLNRIHQSGQGGFYAWYVEEIRKRFPHEVHFRCPSASAAEKSAGLPVVAGAVAIGG